MPAALAASALSCRPPLPPGYSEDPPAHAGDDPDQIWPDASVGETADGASRLPPLPDPRGPCSPGATRCAGVELDTCAPAGDGWVRTRCFPGMACASDTCRPLGNNLILVFDTSGSMASQVPGVACAPGGGFPTCAPAQGCSRIDVSKIVFAKAIASLDPRLARMALFHFPTRIVASTPKSCMEGTQLGLEAMTADSGAHSVTAQSAWYWKALHQVLAVAAPRDEAEALQRPGEIARWMDGSEVVVATGGACGGPLGACTLATSCPASACCDGQCVGWGDPELRATGGTPIGKTLFYVGEYLRHRVVVDGLACQGDADCGTPYHRCVGGACHDGARHCRATTVVLFTDGGESNDPKAYFAPLVQARRMAYGLACASDGDCAGGATCQAKRCLPVNPTGKRCLATGAPCDPAAPAGDALHCPAAAGLPPQCLADPVGEQLASAKQVAANALRSPDGRPFGVRLQVVDVSGAGSVLASFALASAGGGRVLTADTADAAALLGALQTAMDAKNLQVCGNTY